jgi:hypothetical protein
MIHPFKEVPHDAVSMRRPTNMIMASWIRPHRRPILDANQCLFLSPRAAHLPVPNEPDQNLTDDDTDDFQVGHGVDPEWIADFVFGPARWPDRLEEGSHVSNGEKNVTGTY